MTGQLVVDVIEAIALLLAGIYHFRQIDPKAPGSKYSIVVALFLPLIGIARGELLKASIDTASNLPDLGYMLEYSFCLIVAVAWTLNCLHATKNLSRGKRFWAVLGVALIYAAMLGVWFSEIRAGESIAQRSQGNYYWVLRLLPYTYCLGVILTVAIPATLKKSNGHLNAFQKAKFISLLMVQIQLAIYALLIIALSVLKIGNLVEQSYDSPVRRLLHFGIILAYIVSTLSERLYSKVGETAERLADPRGVKRTHFVCNYIANLLDKKPEPVYYPTDPERTVVESFIKMVDQRRLLFLSPNPEAQLTGHKLELLCSEHSEPLKIIDELWKWIKRPK